MDDEYPPPDADPSSPEPWAGDSDAWRGEPPHGATRLSEAAGHRGAWPQLDAAPLYWMWLSHLEQERARAA